VGALLGGGALAERPQVGVDLRIDSRRIQDGLGDRAAAVEAEIEDELATEIESHFQFVNWVSPASGSGSSATLVFTLEEGRPGLCPPPIEQRMSVAHAAGDLPIGDEIELFDGCEHTPLFQMDDLSPFKTAVVEGFRSFLVESRRERLERQFLARIPIANSIEHDAVQQTVLVPLTLGELRAAEASEMLVDFAVESTELDRELRGEITVHPWRDQGGKLGCRPSRFFFAPRSIDTDGWHPDLPIVLDRLVSVHVYMTSYVHDPAAGLTFGSRRSR
jgi:hypothetical protein